MGFFPQGYSGCVRSSPQRARQLEGAKLRRATPERYTCSISLEAKQTVVLRLGVAFFLTDHERSNNPKEKKKN